MEELVSVICPVFNVCEYIEDCIKSIINQTYKNLEIIFIDDGSTDASITIVNNYKKYDKRIKVLSQNNLGVSSARNNGIDCAKGKWIIFVDADDYLEDKAIENLIKIQKKADCDIVMASFYAFEDEVERQHHNFMKVKKKIYKGDDKNQLISAFLGSPQFGNNDAVTNIGVPWAKIFRTSVVNAYNIRFNRRLKNMEDSLFNTLVITKADKVVYSDLPVYNYRIRSNSAARNYSPEFPKMAQLFLNEEYKVLKLLQHKKYVYDAIEYKRVALFFESINISIVHKDSKLNFLGKVRAVKLLKNQPLFQNLRKSDILSKWQRIYLWCATNNLDILLIILLEIRSKIKGKRG